jgi:hypothetical protein
MTDTQRRLSPGGMNPFHPWSDVPTPAFPDAGVMETSTKHTIATLLLCAAIVVVTAVALVAMSPMP